MSSSKLLPSFLFSAVLAVCSATSVFSDTNLTQSDNTGLFEKNLDDFQKYLSLKVLIFSSKLDQIGSSGLDENQTTDSIVDSNRSEDTLQSNFNQPIEENSYPPPLPFDSFFKDDIYLNTTNKSYIKIHGGYEFNQLGPSAISHNVSARIKLPKTQEKLHLFINNEPKKTTLLPTINQSSSDVGIGLKYYLPQVYEKLFSNVSIGFAGITNPYVKTYFEYLIAFTNLEIKSTQNFKYSHKNKFDEWTDFYFDRKLSQQNMVRLLLQRSTNSEVNGMEYLSQLSYTNALEKEISCVYYISVNGRTEDTPASLYENGSIPKEGVYNYSAGVIWRQQFFKDYLYYQIEPILSYHEQYNYKPNYILRFTIDLFFETKR